MKNRKSDPFNRTYLNTKPVFTIDELELFSGISKSTLYKYTMDKSIPFYARGKFNFFDRKEIVQWLKEFPVRQLNIPAHHETLPGTITIEETAK